VAARAVLLGYFVKGWGRIFSGNPDLDLTTLDGLGDKTVIFGVGAWAGSGGSTRHPGRDAGFSLTQRKSFQ
jgi:hypothetical protein